MEHSLAEQHVTGSACKQPLRSFVLSAVLQLLLLALQ
jgi:hypothetical protein